MLIETVFTKNFLAIENSYDVVIFDCQAGYSPLVAWAAALANRNLLVLEADAVTAASIRVLYLRLGSILSRSKTWQLYNKLTEEERGIYERMEAGTLFPNLPPIPFDWQVRAAFALGQIPNTASKNSAFGLGVLRVLRPLIPSADEALNALEKETVGEWHGEIAGIIAELENKKKGIKFGAIKKQRQRRLMLSQWITASVSTVAATFALLDLLIYPATNIIPIITGYLSNFVRTESFFAVTGGLGVISISAAYYYSVKNSIKSEEKQDAAQESLEFVEKELARFRTLLETDPQLREYTKRIISSK